MQRTESQSASAFAHKLGVKPGHLVVALNAPPFLKDILPALLPPQVRFRVDLGPEEQPDIVLFWPDDTTDLPARFQELRHRIRPNGAVWAVIPKRPVADKRGPKIYFDQVLAAALPTGLVDNKTLTFSEEEYGIRFMVRRELRRAKPWEQKDD